VNETARRDLLLYESKDLTTHAVCVGMTGSGKTGLCLTLLEEAALDGIPALAIDPKGDLGNLMLTFPGMAPADFRPWIDESEAARRGMTPDEFAAETARTWTKGLADWGQEGARIARLRAAADVAIYTPGSSAGLPLTVLRSFAAPPAALAADPDALRDRVSSASSGLLALLGIDADPVRSREHILVSNVLQKAWQQGRGLDLAALIRDIQTPPFATIGVVDLESFFPGKERSALAMSLNNLLASPGFAGWLEGEPLDIARLLWTPQGKPRIAILSIAHLPDAERMFFVTLLLNELVAWMRSQAGTSSLRALLYMDEIFGFFPPTANPPSKTPMLTLLKQARAFGLGVVLATQNPVDLDYKGLSNTGTWFLGRLQTERDKARVLEGLEGASAAAGASFDRQRMEATLAGLKSRVFLMNNVHEDEPVLFQTRWALSYLRGPMTRQQIQILMAPHKQVAATAPAVATTAAATPGRSALPEEAQTHTAPISERPLLPPEVTEVFLPHRAERAETSSLIYRPALLATGRVHYTSARAAIDHWETVTLLAPLADDVADDPWEKAETLVEGEPDLEKAPVAGARLAGPPAAATRARSYETWRKSFADHLYRQRVLTIWRSAALRQSSRPGEAEGAFRVRLAQAAHEKRDLQVENLRQRYAPRLAALQQRISTAEERTQREQSQYDQQKLQTAISVGATVLGALFGRKLTSVGNVGRATTAMRGVGRAARERGDVGRAQEGVEALRQQLADMETELQSEAAGLEAAGSPSTLDLEPIQVRPAKSDITVTRIALSWSPWRIGPDGAALPAFR